MKRPFFVIACLLLLPHAALAAQEISLLSLDSLLFPLLLLLAGSAIGWLWSRLRRINRERNTAIARLHLVKQALDQAPLPLLWTDSRLHIIQANQAALQSAGDRQLIGRTLLELHSELVNHPFVTSLSSEFQGAESSIPSDSSVSNGHGISGKTTLTLAAADSHNFAVWYGTLAEEIVPEKGEEEEQRPRDTEGPSQAEESASRLKSEFIANINHEIRTPMNAIIGYAEMLSNSDLGPREKRFVGIIHRSSLTLVSIFNDIMELSKIDSGRMQIMHSSVRLQSIIHGVEELFIELAHEKQLRFRCRIAPHLPQVLILDGLRLKQVLQNLVSNAIKFTTKGYVELKVEGNLSPKNSGCVDLRFSVEDSGIGIPPVDQKKIFELFQQREDSISKQYSGVGLGLTLCSRLVAMMGGWIELFSNEGNGARFTVFLNEIRIAEQAPAELSPETVQPMNSREQKLLIVDDMDLIKDVFTDFFQDSGVKVLTANTGEEALALAVQEQPSIIFMDLNLVGMDGRTVTERLRNQAETATIPVVVMTGEMLDEEDYKPLFDGFLQKPFRLEELKEIVGHYVQLGQTDVPQPLDADNGEGEEQVLLDGIMQTWTPELERLLRQAVRSGSLADAVSLGAAMLKAGEKIPQSLLSELGGELVQYAAEPDILGVDRLLARLTSVANRK